MGKEILNKKQLIFLEVIKTNNDLTKTFYLTGGTALAAFYLNHRESEDLDFFSEDEVEPLAIETFLKSNKAKIGFKKFEFQRSFNRNLFFLHFSDGGALKTEFTYFPFTQLEKGPKEGGLRIDSLKDIAVNKAFTITQQTRTRDFIDLYFIIQRTKWQLANLLKDARIKFDAHIDAIQLGTQLLKAGELKDAPRMKIKWNLNEIGAFFKDEAARLKRKVLF